MSSNLFNRYLWLIETISRYGRITRSEISRLWDRSGVADGQPLARRTFYNYRNAIQELFGVNIECDPRTYEYYIDRGDDMQSRSVTDWMLYSAAVGNALSDASEVAGRIFVEDVPSARSFLGPVISAMKENHPVRFTYHPFTRVNPRHNVVVEPYFLKIFRQRWYITGRNVDDNTIKTYSLDRIRELIVETATFSMPPDFDAEVYCRDSYGIVFNEGKVHPISIKADPHQAKYLRALPLHSSQSETIHDKYSIFSYRMRLTADLVEAIVGFGPSVTVEDPPELRAMVIGRLRSTLSNYR